MGIYRSFSGTLLMFVIELHLCKSDLGEVSEADCQVFRLTAENITPRPLRCVTLLLCFQCLQRSMNAPSRVECFLLAPSQ